MEKGPNEVTNYNYNGRLNEIRKILLCENSSEEMKKEWSLNIMKITTIGIVVILWTSDSHAAPVVREIFWSRLFF